jgi:DNA-binding NarL/FixJ family response regulator
MSSIKVLIVDDVVRVREDLRTLLSLAGDIQIVGEAGDGNEAVRHSEILQPEVVLMDLEMPLLNGLEATRQIKSRQPGCRVIVLTIHGDQIERNRAFSAGADCFLEKGTPLHTLLAAIYGENKSNQSNNQ